MLVLNVAMFYVACFNNIFYAQKRGLALGNRIAPLLAIAFLDHIEKASLTKGIIFYKRYTDDVFATGSSYSELATTFAKLNSMESRSLWKTLSEMDSYHF